MYFDKAKTFNPGDPESPLNQNGYVGVSPQFQTPGEPLASKAPEPEDSEESDLEPEKEEVSTPATVPAPTSPVAQPK